MALNVRAVALPLHADEDGVMRIGGTRVTLDTLVNAFDEGSTPEEISSRFPALKLADVYAVIAYYLNHGEAVRRYLEQQKKATGELWDEIEPRPGYRLFRERLLARTGKAAS